MTIATDVQKEALAQAYASGITHASLHSADPGTTGASELAGARQAITWTAGATDGVVVSNTLSFAVGAGINITHVGLWSALTGGVFKDSIVARASFASAGTYQITITYTQS